MWRKRIAGASSIRMMTSQRWDGRQLNAKGGRKAWKRLLVFLSAVLPSLHLNRHGVVPRTCGLPGIIFAHGCTLASCTWWPRQVCDSAILNDEYDDNRSHNRSPSLDVLSFARISRTAVTLFVLTSSTTQAHQEFVDKAKQVVCGVIIPVADVKHLANLSSFT
jgi:hypothetical protein